MRTQLAVNSRFSRNETEEPQFPKVVLIYEDVPAGERAIDMLTNIFHQSTDDPECRPQLWRFQHLEDPDWFGVALADAIHADIVVIATSSALGLNNSVTNWIKLCLKRKRGTSAAIVALFGPAESMDGSDSSRFKFLQGAAREAGLEFFAPRSCHKDCSDVTEDSIRRRAETVTSTLDEILHHVRIGHGYDNELMNLRRI